MSQYFDQKNMFLEPEVKQHGSHMVMTNVTMPTKEKYLTIDTRFRDEYDASALANYNISLPERLTNVRSLEVTNMEVPITFYNISSRIGNNTFHIKIGVMETTIKIPSGNYTESTLASTITSTLSSQGAPYNDISFTITNKKAEFKNNGSNDCTITFDTTDCIRPSEGPMSRLGWLLGYRLKSYVLPGSTDEIGESFVSINGLRYIYLILDEYTSSNPKSFLSLSRTSQLSSQPIIARISMDYNDYPFGTVLSAELGSYLRSDVRSYANEVNLQRFNIRLVDEFGSILDLNGMDFSFCLKIQHL